MAKTTLVMDILMRVRKEGFKEADAALKRVVKAQGGMQKHLQFPSSEKLSKENVLAATSYLNLNKAQRSAFRSGKDTAGVWKKLAPTVRSVSASMGSISKQTGTTAPFGGIGKRKKTTRAGKETPEEKEEKDKIRNIFKMRDAARRREIIALDKAGLLYKSNAQINEDIQTRLDKRSMGAVRHAEAMKRFKKEDHWLGRMKKRISTYNGASRTLDHTTKKLTATNMSFLGVMFGMMGVMNVTSRLMGAIFMPLGNLAGMFETFAMSIAFGSEANRDLMKNIDPALMTDSWMKYMGVVADVKLALLDMAVGVFQGKSFEKIQTAVEEFVEFATDSTVQDAVGKLAETMITMVTVGGKALIRIFEFMTSTKEFAIPFLGITTSMEKLSPVLLKWAMYLAAISIIILPLLSVVTMLISVFSFLVSGGSILAGVFGTLLESIGLVKAGGLLKTLSKSRNKCCKLQGQQLMQVGSKSAVGGGVGGIRGLVTSVIPFIPMIIAAVIIAIAAVKLGQMVADREDVRKTALYGADWRNRQMEAAGGITSARALSEFGDREGTLLGTRTIDTLTPEDQFNQRNEIKVIVGTREVAYTVEDFARLNNHTLVN